MTQEKKPFENNLGKEETAVNQLFYLIFHIVSYSVIWATLMILLNAFR